MNKQECVNLVNRVYALWNQQPPTTGQKDIYEAWWTLMADLELQHALDALTALSIQDTYMPRPGTLRRKTIDRQNPQQPPTPLEAWNQLRTITEAIHTGTYTPQQLHPALQQTIKKTGVELHTNNDREQFIKLYEQTCQQWQEELYSPKQ